MGCDNTLINAHVSLRWHSSQFSSFNPEDPIMLAFSAKIQGGLGLSDCITILELLEQNTRNRSIV